jgi:hypothetical protein
MEGPTPSQTGASSEPTRSRILTLASAHPDWKVTRLAKEVDRSETWVRRILRSEGVALKSQWRARRRRGVKTLQVDEPRVSDSTAASAVKATAKARPHSRSLTFRLDRRSKKLLRGFTHSVERLTRTSRQLSIARYNPPRLRSHDPVSRTEAAVELARLGLEPLRQDVRRVAEGIEVLPARLEFLRPPRPTPARRAHEMFQLVRDYFEADEAMKRAGLPGLPPEALKTAAMLGVWELNKEDRTTTTAGS